jgi:hypothetical protein
VQALNEAEEASGKQMTRPNEPSVVVITPTAELCAQVVSVARTLSRGVPFRSFAVTGMSSSLVHLVQSGTLHGVVVSTKDDTRVNNRCKVGACMGSSCPQKQHKCQQWVQRADRMHSKGALAELSKKPTICA